MISSIKNFFYYLIEDPKSKAKKWFDVIITIIIAFSIMIFLYEVSEENSLTFELNMDYQGEEIKDHQKIQKEFLRYGYNLSAESQVDEIAQGQEWKITDPTQLTFSTFQIIKKEKTIQVTSLEKTDLFKKLHIIDFYVILIFILEYLLRFWLCSDVRKDYIRGYNHHRTYSKLRRVLSGFQLLIFNKLKHVLSPMAIIDLLAILPFLRPLRFLRVLRLVRLLKVIRYSKSMDSLISVFKDRAFEFLVLVALIGLLLIFTSALIFMVEKDSPQSSFRSITDALWWSIVTLTTVGYGDVYPTTPVGRMFGGVVMLLGIGVLAIPSGILASALTEKLQEIKQGASNMNSFKDHMVICGWNDIAKGLLKKIQKKGIFDGTVVVITENEKFNYPDAHYKRGNFAKESILNETNIAEAKHIIILAENLKGYPAESVDARTILTTMMVEKLNSKGNILVEIQNKSNSSLLKSHNLRAELLTSDEITSTLLLSAVNSPGASSIVTHLLSHDENKIYKVSANILPLDKITHFSELINYFRNLEIPGIPISLERDGKHLINPTDEIKIEEQDTIFYISTESYFS